MKVPVKLTVFAATLALAFGAAFGVGSVFDPIADGDRTVDLASTDDSENGEHSDMGSGDDTEDPTDEAQSDAPAGSGGSSGIAPLSLDVAGLAVSERGYTLRIEDTTPGSGEEVEVAFTIASPDGGPVLNFEPTHEKEMHLIVVRRDLTRFQHLHPERDESGTWRVPVDLSDAGVYRFFADFVPTALNDKLSLGADVFVPGEFGPAELPSPSTSWSSEDYEVVLSGSPAAGSESVLAFTVRRDGEEVDDLEPYLAAFGHLVALRSGDLGYLHTHPAEEASAGQQGGPEIRFGTTFPTAGLYRLYLNFAHDGVVRTAEFTLDIRAGADTPVAPISAGQSPAEPAEDEPAEPETADDGHSEH